MLTTIPSGSASSSSSGTPSAGPSSTLADVVWIDLLDPTDEERAEVERVTQLRLPTRAALEEIESSSRVFMEGGAFYLSTPVLETTDCMNAAVTSIGFVLSPARLVTLRFARISAFEAAAASYAAVAAPSASDAFLKIMETIVDFSADALENANAQLEKISRAAFHTDGARQLRPAEASGALREGLRKLGRMGDGVSHIRGTLLGLGRIAAFVHENRYQNKPEKSGETQLASEATRSSVMRTDIVSLNDYQGHLSNKIQFLLDATLGFISIAQNDIVKMLTVVSVVGVPPVLIAGIYGMNFKNMPELSWSLGYPLALALIVVSGLLPVAWLKWRGWM